MVFTHFLFYSVLPSDIIYNCLTSYVVRRRSIEKREEDDER